MSNEGSDFDDKSPWETFYGNGPVYIARGSKLLSLPGANFDVERIDEKDKRWGDYWIDREVVVALGDAVSRAKAVKTLKRIVAKLESDAVDDSSMMIQSRKERKLNAKTRNKKLF